MGFRYRKSIRIAPGVRLNLSKRGISTSIGPRGAKLNFSKRGVRATNSIPGSGISYSKQMSSRKRSTSREVATVMATRRPGLFRRFFGWVS